MIFSVIFSVLDGSPVVFVLVGARCSSVVRVFAHGVRWVAGLILHGGFLGLFLVLTSATRLVLSCLWDDANKRTLAHQKR